MTTEDKSLIPSERIERSILFIRGQKVILDRDLAELYGVQTMVLNQAVKRNKDRFPEDFMFQLNREEMKNWISQFVISNSSLKMGLRKPPYAFTEHGVVMLSSVLKSKRAIHVNIAITRAFIQMRQLLASQTGLMRKIVEMEKKYDRQFIVVFDAIKKLMAPPKAPKKKLIGFARC